MLRDICTEYEQIFLTYKCGYFILVSVTVEANSIASCSIFSSEHCCQSRLLRCKFHDLELFCFDLIDAKRCSPTRIFVVYRPPSYNEHATVYMQPLIDCFKTYYKNSYVNVIASPTYLPKIDWFQPQCSNDIIHQLFLEFVIEFGLTQVINFPTRGNNFLDIVQIDDLQRLSSVSRRPPFSTSDHDVIQLSLLFLLDVASPDWSHDRYLWHNADFCL